MSRAEHSCHDSRILCEHFVIDHRLHYILLNRRNVSFSSRFFSSRHTHWTAVRMAIASSFNQSVRAVLGFDSMILKTTARKRSQRFNVRDSTRIYDRHLTMTSIVLPFNYLIFVISLASAWKWSENTFVSLATTF